MFGTGNVQGENLFVLCNDLLWSEYVFYGIIITKGNTPQKNSKIALLLWNCEHFLLHLCYSWYKPSLEWGKDRFVYMTNGTHPWSFQHSTEKINNWRFGISNMSCRCCRIKTIESMCQLTLIFSRQTIQHERESHALFIHVR
jgi:hypothetical protein